MSSFVVVLNRPEAAMFAHSLLFLNKEEKERTGVVNFNGNGLRVVEDEWTRQDMSGSCAIGVNSLQKGEPFAGTGRYGHFALCTAGEIPNGPELRIKFGLNSLRTGSNAELFSNLVMKQLNCRQLKNALKAALEMVEGDFAFSAVYGDDVFVGCCGDLRLLIGKIIAGQKGLLIASDVRLFLSIASLESEMKQNEIFMYGRQTELFVK